MSRNGLLAIADYHIERQKLVRGGGADPLGDALASPPPAPELPDDPKQNLKWEREYLGFYLSGDPLDHIPQATAIAGVLGEDTERGGKRVEIVGVVLESDIKRTRKGTLWSQFLLQDKRGAIRAFSFGEETQVRNGYVGRFKGSLVVRDDAVELKVFEFKLLEEW